MLNGAAQPATRSVGDRLGRSVITESGYLGRRPAESAKQVGSRVALRLVGRIGNPQLAELDDHVQHLIQRGLRYLTIDLAGVERCTGRLVSQLARTDELLRARGGELRLAGLGAGLMGVLPSASLPEVFTVYRAARLDSDPPAPGSA